jgi:glycosyltransferase involved in cell wall biosynthesis
MKEEPLVSVIIPTYKRPDMLGRAIDSVLNQTYDNIEIVVVDDNDEDSEYRRETEEFMEKYADVDNLVYLKHKRNKGGSAARNTGIKYSHGEFISFLDDDDEYLPHLISKKITKLKSLDSSWGGVYSGVLKKYKKNNINILPKKNGDLKKELLLQEFDIGSGSNLFIKSKIIKNLNKFDESFVRHQDWEFLVRFFQISKLAYIDEVLIIKNNDDKINKPNPNQLLQTKEQYLTKFKNDIIQFDKKTQKLIYKRQYFEVAKAYCKNKDYRRTMEIINKINEYYKLKLVDYLKLLLSFIDGYIEIKTKLIQITNYNTS